MDDNNKTTPNDQQQAGYQPPPNYQQAGYQPPPPGYQPPPPGFQPPPGYQQPYGYSLPNRPVGFIEAYVAYWKNFANFNDRTSRAGFWWVVLMNIIINIVLSSISSVASIGLLSSSLSVNSFDVFNPLSASFLAGAGVISYISSVWGVLNIIPVLALSVRRLHDVGKRWVWILFLLLPVVGWIILIVLYASEQKHPPENSFAYLRQV